MPLLLGIQDFNPVLGTRITPHPQGVYLNLSDKRLTKELWDRYYPHWQLGVQDPGRFLALLLTDKKLTLALAESCTGGGIANALTNQPGASQYLQGGVVVYTPEAKTKLLGIPRDELPPGGVGPNLTLAMAASIGSVLKADLGLGITGALGPLSPAPDVSVGEVYIAVQGMGKSKVCKFNFCGDRQTIKTAAIDAAINFVLVCLARW